MRIFKFGDVVILTDGFSTKNTPNVENASLRGQACLEFFDG